MGRYGVASSQQTRSLTQVPINALFAFASLHREYLHRRRHHMTETRRCIVIPAIKKNAVIPDQLVKRLAGSRDPARHRHGARRRPARTTSWSSRTARKSALICERNGVRVHWHRAALHLAGHHHGDEIHPPRTGQRLRAHHAYRASCPLLTMVDIDDAYKTFLENEADCLVTVKSVSTAYGKSIRGGWNPSCRRRIRAGGREQGPHHRQSDAGRRYHPTYGTVFPQ